MMMLDLIEKKKKGQPLTRADIRYFVEGFTKGDIPGYQASALLMAIVLKGMDARETADLTRCMMHSGQMLDFSSLGVLVADKHSTGGVSDTTTLILVPLCASLGVTMAKMSGRGLGYTGGTIDKLETIPGYRTEMDIDEIRAQLKHLGAVIVGQSADLAPADKKLYALRDASGTVDSMALIASSIMSKKLALGADVIVLDVKTGSGAFMKTQEEAFALARTMVDIGTHLGRKVSAVVSGMDQPLGRMIGNALELREAIETLQGQHMDSDLLEVVTVLGVEILRLTDIEPEAQKARAMLRGAIQSGAGLEMFKKLIQAQGGDAGVCDHPKRLGKARRIVDVFADASGIVSSMDTADIGWAAQMLGAGRSSLTDSIDPAVGIEMRVRVGDTVDTGDIICRLHVNDETNAQAAKKRVSDAVHIGDHAQPLSLIYGTVNAQGQTRA